MKQIFLAFVIAIVWQTAASAQATYSYTLQQCIDTALKKNIEVRQSSLLTETAAINLKQARSNRLPDLYVTADHGNNNGRSIDPFTNTYVNQSVSYASYGISSGVVMFNGAALQNTVKQAAYGYEASGMELQQAKDNLTLNVVLAYLQVLSNQDLLLSAMRQKELSAKQLERLEILDRQGAISPSQLSDVKGQLMNDELNILSLKNGLETSKLVLSQLMNVPYSNGMQLEKINAAEFIADFTRSSNEIYETALQHFSLIKAAALRKRSAQYAVKAAKGALYPSLVLGGGAQTAYSSIAQNNTGKIGYSDQVKNNVFNTLNVGLRIPIFNAARAKNNIRLAGIAVRNNALLEEDTKVKLRQQIEQAHLNMTNAYERYKTLTEQVAAYTISFGAADARFNAGVGTSVDYLIAKNNLDRANINLISAQYEFVLRKKVLDYYSGISLP